MGMSEMSPGGKGRGHGAHGIQRRGRQDGCQGVLRRLGEWCARHFVIVIVAWLVALAALQVLNRSFGGDYSDDFSLSGVQSQHGLQVLKEHDPAAGGYSSQIVLHDKDKQLTSLNSQMSETVGDLQKLPHVLSVQNPLPQPGTQPPASSSPNVGPSPPTRGPRTSPSASTCSRPPSATATSTASTPP